MLIRAMRIQLLTFPGCPNAAAARDALREALSLEDLHEDIEEIDVSSSNAPPWARGWGSPTILINSNDVTGAGPSDGDACCRLYPAGVPTVLQIRTRLAADRGW
jgi:hypothetical protein